MLRKIFTLLSLPAFVLSLAMFAGCSEEAGNGDTGDAVEDAADNAQDNAEGAADAMKDAADDAGDAAEDAADDAADNMGY